MNWKQRIADATAGANLDDDVLEELTQHAAATYAAARADGDDAADAERRVDRQIEAWAANPELLHRRPKRAPALTPPIGQSSAIASIAQDARYAWRLHRRQPAYAALVIATMGLGIAATTILGSVAYGVLLKPLPWADAPRLVRLYESRDGGARRFGPMMTNATYTEWRRESATLDAIGGWTIDHLRLEGDESGERLRVAPITASLMPMLGAAPEIGRVMAEDEEEPGRQAIVLSHALWQQRFGGRTDILGRTVRLDDTPYSIVGVMPAGFSFPDRETQAWIPFRYRIGQVFTPPGPGTKGGFSITMFQSIGRLRPGVTPAQAAAEGTARGAAAPNQDLVGNLVFGSRGAVQVTAMPLLDALVGDVKPAILILLAAVALLLVTAVANVASLELARATVRRRELAIRSALGAGRGRLIRQTLVENLLLAALGGLAGLALAAVMHRALPGLLPADFPRVGDLAFDLRIQLFALALSAAAGLGCGLLPALHVARHAVVPALAEDSLAPVGVGGRSPTSRLRAVIMTAQVAIACVLLVGASLLVRSFTAMLHADVGYDATNVLTAEIALPESGYAPERRGQIMDEIVQRLARVDGVTRAAFATGIPFAGGVTLQTFTLPPPGGGAGIDAQAGMREVSPGYFAAIGQNVLEGRAFAADDTAAAPPVAIVNREFSRRYLADRALGRTLPGFAPSKSKRPTPDRTIVGVVGDTARQSVADAAEPEVYVPSAQQPLRYSELYLVVRTVGDPRALTPVVRSIARQAAKAAAVDSIMTLEDRTAETLTRPRLYAVLLGTFAAFALAIAGVGLFGVLSYSVAQRSREIGVRSALGARVRDIIGLVVGQSMAIAITGLAIGLVASAWLMGLLQKFLFGVTPHDFVSFGAVAGVLLLVAAVASVVPARRAARVDPVQVLRG